MIVVAQALTKTTGESIRYGFDFSRVLSSGETISAVSSVTATTPSGAEALTLASPTGSGSLATCRISGGTAGQRYRVTCTVTTSTGNTRQCLGDLDVSDG